VTARILIVDDEAPLLKVMKNYLTRLGYEVTTCSTSSEGWAAFEAGSPGWDLLILDMTMAEMTGEELARKALGLNPLVRLLLCSGYPLDPARFDAAPGHVAFLHKPFAPETLSGAVEQLLLAP
jgi:CheY-like chemotaxis protein